jgi:hypothetical protein
MLKNSNMNRDLSVAWMIKTLKIYKIASVKWTWYDPYHLRMPGR